MRTSLLTCLSIFLLLPFYFPPNFNLNVFVSLLGASFKRKAKKRKKKVARQQLLSADFVRNSAQD